jgi:hypothetical protein
MKQLFRVAVEGELWVLGENATEARREARLAARQCNLEEIDFHVYDMLPISLSLVASDDAESIPYGAEPGDDRTVGDHIRAANAAREARRTQSDGG